MLPTVVVKITCFQSYGWSINHNCHIQGLKTKTLFCSLQNWTKSINSICYKVKIKLVYDTATACYSLLVLHVCDSSVSALVKIEYFPSLWLVQFSESFRVLWSGERQCKNYMYDDSVATCIRDHRKKGVRDLFWHVCNRHVRYFRGNDGESHAWVLLNIQVVKCL